MIAALLKYGHWLIIAALVLLCQHLYFKGLNLQLDLAQAGRATAEERELRERAARRHEAALAKREQTHAAEQQEKDDDFKTAKADLQERIGTERARADGLRRSLAAATARSGAGSEADPAVCRSALDRLEALGGLAGEGVQLLSEGRGLLQQRDLDVQRLFDQVTIDRKACGQEG